MSPVAAVHLFSNSTDYAPHKPLATIFSAKSRSMITALASAKVTIPQDIIHLPSSTLSQLSYSCYFREMLSFYIDSQRHCGPVFPGKHLEAGSFHSVTHSSLPTLALMNLSAPCETYGIKLINPRILHIIPQTVLKCVHPKMLLLLPIRNMHY